jgi:ATP-binding cassette subfamily B multidrug efflux pump
VSTSEKAETTGAEQVRPPVSEMRGGGFGSGRMSSAGVPLEKSMNFGASMRRLFRRMGPERSRLVLVLLLAVVSVVLVVFGPKVLGHATDIIVTGLGSGGIDFGALHQTLFLAAGLYATSAVLAWFQAYTLAGVVQRTMYGLRLEVEDKLNKLPLSYIDGQSRGDLLRACSRR